MLLEVAAHDAAAGKGIEAAQLAPTEARAHLRHRPADEIEQASLIAQVGDNLLLQKARVLPGWRCGTHCGQL